MFESYDPSFAQPFGELPGDECDYGYDPTPRSPEPETSTAEETDSAAGSNRDGEPEEERRMLLRLGANGF